VKSLQFVAAAFLANDPSVFDMNDAIRERQKTRIVRHNQHRALLFLGDSSKDPHDRLAILAIQ
jgi:hypothetical protein